MSIDDTQLAVTFNARSGSDMGALNELMEDADVAAGEAQTILQANGDDLVIQPQVLRALLRRKSERKRKTKMRSGMVRSRLSGEARPMAMDVETGVVSLMTSGDLFDSSSMIAGPSSAPKLDNLQGGKKKNFWQKTGSSLGKAVGQAGLEAGNEIVDYGSRRAQRELDNLDGGLRGAGFWEKTGKGLGKAAGEAGLAAGNEIADYGSRRAQRELDKLDGGARNRRRPEDRKRMTDMEMAAEDIGAAGGIVKQAAADTGEAMINPFVAAGKKMTNKNQRKQLGAIAIDKIDKVGDIGVDVIEAKVNPAGAAAKSFAQHSASKPYGSIPTMMDGPEQASAMMMPRAEVPQGTRRPMVQTQYRGTPAAASRTMVAPPPRYNGGPQPYLTGQGRSAAEKWADETSSKVKKEAKKAGKAVKNVADEANLDTAGWNAVAEGAASGAAQGLLTGGPTGMVSGAAQGGVESYASEQYEKQDAPRAEREARKQAEREAEQRQRGRQAQRGMRSARNMMSQSRTAPPGARGKKARMMRGRGLSGGGSFASGGIGDAAKARAMYLQRQAIALQSQAVARAQALQGGKRSAAEKFFDDAGKRAKKVGNEADVGTKAWNDVAKASAAGAASGGTAGAFGGPMGAAIGTVGGATGGAIGAYTDAQMNKKRKNGKSR